MQEYQSPQSRAATLEDSYSYPEVGGRVAARYNRAEVAPAATFRYRVLKRCVDVTLVLAASPLIVLAVAMIAAIVVLSSPGPIFYSHRRIRKNGAFFSMWSSEQCALIRLRFWKII